MAATIGCAAAGPKLAARPSRAERFDQERVPSAGGGEVAGAVERRAGLALAQELGRLQGGERVEVHDRGARLGAEPGDALGGAGGRIGAGVASTSSGTCSSSRRNRRWRSRSTVAVSAQSMSSTNTTVGEVRTCSSTRSASVRS